MSCLRGLCSTLRHATVQRRPNVVANLVTSPTLPRAFCLPLTSVLDCTHRLPTLRRALTGPLSSKLRHPLRGLEEFREPEPLKADSEVIVGRPWTVPELRKKSFEDLHKLWFVLYKERNMLLTEALHCKRDQQRMPQADRRLKVKRSMKAIRVVVGERQRVKQALLKERQRAARAEERKQLTEGQEEEEEEQDAPSSPHDDSRTLQQAAQGVK